MQRISYQSFLEFCGAMCPPLSDQGISIKWLKSILNRLRKEFKREIIEINCRLNLPEKKIQREIRKSINLKKSINFISRKIYQRRNSQLPFTFFWTKLVRLCFVVKFNGQLNQCQTWMLKVSQCTINLTKNMIFETSRKKNVSTVCLKFKCFEFLAALLLQNWDNKQKPVTLCFKTNR